MRSLAFLLAFVFQKLLTGKAHGGPVRPPIPVKKGLKCFFSFSSTSQQWDLKVVM